jgi:hypothetical protein
VSVPRQHQWHPRRVWSSHARDRLPAIRAMKAAVSKVEISFLPVGLASSPEGNFKVENNQVLRTDEGSSAGAVEQPSVDARSLLNRDKRAQSAPFETLKNGLRLGESYGSERNADTLKSEGPG